MKNELLPRERADIIDLFMTGLNAIDAYRLTERSVSRNADVLEIKDILGCRKSYDLSESKRILIAGFGKAAYPMAKAIEQILHGKITRGIMIAPYGTNAKLKCMDFIEAGHPVPDMNSVRGARLIAEMMDSTTESDLIILLVSGGGSALCTLPAPGIDLDEIGRTNDILLKSGACIEEINTIRKHLSQIKGGQLAKLALPAQVAALIISDVIGDPPHAIASGPAAPDPSTFSEACHIIRKYKITEKIPPNIYAYLEAGCRGEIPETPKPGESFFEKTKNFIIGSNIIALQAIAGRARQKGYRPFILSSRISGDTRNVAKVIASAIADFKRNKITVPLCLISGGEMTAAVKGTGTGGRNQDFCLSLVPLIKGIEDVQILSAGTDGIDGNTDAAGAIVDGNTYERASVLGIDVEHTLANYDAYTLLDATDSLLITGPTRTNVMDIQIILLR